MADVFFAFVVSAIPLTWAGQVWLLRQALRDARVAETDIESAPWSFLAWYKVGDAGTRIFGSLILLSFAIGVRYEAAMTWLSPLVIEGSIAVMSALLVLQTARGIRMTRRMKYQSAKEI